MKLTDKTLAAIERMRCPHLISKRAGDEGYYWCELGGSCRQEYGNGCEIWNEIQAEEKNDKA